MSKARPEKPKPRTAPDPEPGGRRPRNPAPRPPAGTAPRSFPPWVSALLAPALVALILLVYAAVAHYDFVAYDDPAYVTENPRVLAGLSWSGAAWAWTTGYAANWHPLTWMSHMLDVTAFGARAGMHHLTNLLLHVAATLLLFAFLSRATGAPGRSAFAAGLFAVHPLHVESVAWIAERKDVLSTLFGMLALWAYAGYVRRPAVGRYLAVAACFSASLLAKPMLVTLPFVLLLLDLWPFRRATPGGGTPWPRLVLEKLPLFCLSAASSLATYLVQRQGGAVSSLDLYPLALRIENALVSYVAYIGKMVWPLRLSVMYPYPQAIPFWQAAGAALLLAGISFLAVLQARHRPWLPVGWFWYLGTLVPVIGLVQVGIQSMADRYTYVPLVGLFIAVAWGVPDLLERRRPRRLAMPAAALCVIGVCAALARAQVGVWKDNVALWTHATEVTLNMSNHVAHNSLGIVLEKQGRLEEALAHFSEAVRVRPDFAEAQHNLGKALAKAGRYDEALSALAAAVRFDPGNAAVHSDLAIVLAGLGRLDEAITRYSEALRIDPARAQVHNALGVALAGVKRPAEARGHFAEAVRLNPGFAEARNNLGLALAGEGRIQDASREFSEAVRLKPDYAEAHNNLGLALAGQGRIEEAIAHYSEAVRLKPGFEAARVNLAMALAGAGRRDEAVGQLNAILAADPDNRNARAALAYLTRRKN